MGSAFFKKPFRSPDLIERRCRANRADVLHMLRPSSTCSVCVRTSVKKERVVQSLNNSSSSSLPGVGNTFFFLLRKEEDQDDDEEKNPATTYMTLYINI